jgi:hypothetical protein
MSSLGTALKTAGDHLTQEHTPTLFDDRAISFCFLSLRFGGIAVEYDGGRLAR